MSGEGHLNGEPVRASDRRTRVSLYLLSFLKFNFTKNYCHLSNRPASYIIRQHRQRANRHRGERRERRTSGEGHLNGDPERASERCAGEFVFVVVIFEIQIF